MCTALDPWSWEVGVRSSPSQRHSLSHSCHPLVVAILLSLSLCDTNTTQTRQPNALFSVFCITLNLRLALRLLLRIIEDQIRPCDKPPSRSQNVGHVRNRDHLRSGRVVAQVGSRQAFYHQQLYHRCIRRGEGCFWRSQSQHVCCQQCAIQVRPTYLAMDLC